LIEMIEKKSEEIGIEPEVKSNRKKPGSDLPPKKWTRDLRCFS